MLGRAALLLECAHFVNRCNKGDWPNWMKLSYGGLCTIEKNHSSQQSISGRNVSVQKNAGMLFHQWAEVMLFYSRNQWNWSHWSLVVNDKLFKLMVHCHTIISRLLRFN